MTTDVLVSPHLEGLARFEQRVDEALEAARIAPVPTPDPALYARQIQNGTPLLKGEACPDLDFVADAVEKLTRALGCDETPAMLRLLTWRVIQRVLSRAVAQLAPLRESWTRPDCPTCGAMTALTMLVDGNNGRQRMLVCACCQTTWNAKRLGCIYCGDESPKSRAILHIENDRTCRLDVCTACNSYMKTFIGQFPEDGPTLHLDYAARERGYERRGASLYDLGA